MKFRCERDVLDRAFSIARRAVAGRGGTLQVLSGLHLELKGNRLTVVGSDLDLVVRVTVEVGGEKDGSVVLSAQLGSDIVRAFDSGQVEVTVDDDGASVVSGRSNFSLRVMSSEEYPKFDEPSGESVTLDAGTVADALDQVIKAASLDDARQILTGVLMAAEEDGLRFVATDSYRLAVRDLPGTAVLGRMKKRDFVWLPPDEQNSFHQISFLASYRTSYSPVAWINLDFVARLSAAVAPRNMADLTFDE